MYHPEMDETPDLSKLFYMSHNFRDSYLLQWRRERDAEAQETLRQLRVKMKNLRFHLKGEHGSVLGHAADSFACLVTGHAHDKIMTAGLSEYEMLLD